MKNRFEPCETYAEPLKSMKTTEKPLQTPSSTHYCKFPQKTHKTTLIAIAPYIFFSLQKTFFPGLGIYHLETGRVEFMGRSPRQAELLSSATPLPPSVQGLSCRTTSDGPVPPKEALQILKDGNKRCLFLYFIIFFLKERVVFKLVVFF